MIFINVATPWALLIALFLTICVIYIGKEAKNAYVPMMALIIFLIMLVMHGMEFLTLPAQHADLVPQLSKCLLIDFVMIFVSYSAYLWVDDIEAKEKKKKSISNTLDWFWKNV